MVVQLSIDDDVKLLVAPVEVELVDTALVTVLALEIDNNLSVIILRLVSATSLKSGVVVAFDSVIEATIESVVSVEFDDMMLCVWAMARESELKDERNPRQASAMKIVRVIFLPNLIVST